MKRPVPFRDKEVISPGFLVIGNWDDSTLSYGTRGVAVVLQLIEHRGGIVRDDHASGPLKLGVLSAGWRGSWVGWYSKSILANNWEPYDQPHADAYLPATVERQPTNDGGALVRSCLSHHPSLHFHRTTKVARFTGVGGVKEHIRAAIQGASQLNDIDVDFLVRPRIVPGSRVAMSKRLKFHLSRTSPGHLAEFGDCAGAVIGPTFKDEDSRHVDVCWEPSGLKYSYEASELDIYVEARPPTSRS